MKRFLVPALFLLLFSVCGLTLGLHPLPAAASETSPSDTTSWAAAVISYKPGAGTIGANFSDPASALGEVDAGIVALGNAQTPSGPPADPNSCEAVLIVDFGPYLIRDGEGDDLIIYELAGGGLPEPIWVYIGGADTGWRLVGESPGGRDPMDISNVADPEETFSQVALCDVPDGDTTIGAAPGPDIDAIAATYTSRIGLVAQAQGPGWFVDLDPARATRAASVFTPLVEFEDLGFAPPAVFQFRCQEGEELSECNSYLIVKSNCGGELTSAPPALFIYPFLFPTINDLGGLVSLRELQFDYQEERLETLYAFCNETPDRAAAADPVSIFTLDKGGARFVTPDERWRYELQTPTASIYSEGLTHFVAQHYPDGGLSVVRVMGGSVEVDPTAPGEEPFTLSTGQQVVIGDDGPGPVMELDFLYLPVTQ